MKKHLFVAIVLPFLSVIGGPAQSATIDLVTTSSYNGPTGRVDDAEFVRGLNTLGGPSAYSFSASQSGPGASASSRGSLDIETGELRAFVEAKHDEPTSTTGIEAGATVEATLGESFIVVGDGLITVNFAVDGLWDVARSDGDPIWNTQSVLSVTGIGTDFVNIGASERDPDSGSFDETLSLSFFARDGQAAVVRSTIITSIGSSTTGFVDLSSTGTLSFELSAGQRLSFNDGRTLSRDPDMGVVPLPASLPLLLGAFGILALRRSSLSGSK